MASKPDEFSLTAHTTIEDFAREDRGYHLSLAHNAANDMQRISLDTT
jgi:hypothetical protein